MDHDGPKIRLRSPKGPFRFSDRSTSVAAREPSESENLLDHSCADLAGQVCPYGAESIRSHGTWSEANSASTSPIIPVHTFHLSLACTYRQLGQVRREGAANFRGARHRHVLLNHWPSKKGGAASRIALAKAPAIRTGSRARDTAVSVPGSPKESDKAYGVRWKAGLGEKIVNPFHVRARRPPITI
jgi:hypothetical protein